MCRVRRVVVGVVRGGGMRAALRFGMNFFSGASRMEIALARGGSGALHPDPHSLGEDNLRTVTHDYDLTKQLFVVQTVRVSQLFITHTSPTCACRTST